jgi:hypothetical protein
MLASPSAAKPDSGEIGTPWSSQHLSLIIEIDIRNSELADNYPQFASGFRNQANVNS